MAVEQEDSGIYYPIGDAIPIQLVIVPKLSKEHNYWLNNLRNDLKAGSEIKKITETSYGKSSEKLNWDAIVKPGLSILSDIWFKIIVEKHIVYLTGIR